MSKKEENLEKTEIPEIIEHAKANLDIAYHEKKINSCLYDRSIELLPLFKEAMKEVKDIINHLNTLQYYIDALPKEKQGTKDDYNKFLLEFNTLQDKSVYKKYLDDKIIDKRCFEQINGLISCIHSDATARAVVMRMSYILKFWTEQDNPIKKTLSYDDLYKIHKLILLAINKEGADRATPNHIREATQEFINSLIVYN